MIIKTQTIINHLVLAASNIENHLNLEDLDETTPVQDDRDRDLTLAIQLMVFLMQIY